MFLFPYGIGVVMNDFGYLTPLSNESWGIAWHWWYGSGFYDCHHWPIEEPNGHI